jgi:glycosyltransferase involved in cell wall biosynthesis
MKPSGLKVAIYAQLKPQNAGGIAEAVLQLVRELGRLDGEESYVVITSPESAEWLRPHIGPNQTIAVTTEHLSHTGPAWERKLASLIKSRATRLLPIMERAWQGMAPIRSHSRAMSNPPYSNGFVESLGAQVIHFPYQQFIRTGVPSIYEPWDLQHRHLPQFFNRGERQARDNLYQSACRSATLVVVASDWVRNDLVKQYQVPRPKILTVRRGSATTASSSDSSLATHKAMAMCVPIPNEFMLYPAHCWPHKNHLRLLDSVARLRDAEGLRVHLVCTGGLHHDFPSIQAHVRSLRLEDQVSFLGYVSHEDLRALYSTAKFLIFPSLFEGYGFPLVEAMQAGLPIACSNVTSVPETVADAALMFDPWKIESISNAVRQLWQDASIRESLVQRGRARLHLFDPSHSAKTFRALYRRLAGELCTDEDEYLLRLAS